MGGGYAAPLTPICSFGRMFCSYSVLVLQEIEREDVIWRSKQDRQRDRLERKKRAQEEEAANASPVAEPASGSSDSEVENTKSAPLKPFTGFY